MNPLQQTWRVGRKVGRTIYAQVSLQPSDDDVLIGMMDTRELAYEVVEMHNIGMRLREVFGAPVVDEDDDDDDEAPTAKIENSFPFGLDRDPETQTWWAHRGNEAKRIPGPLYLRLTSSDPITQAEAIDEIEAMFKSPVVGS